MEIVFTSGKLKINNPHPYEKDWQYFNKNGKSVYIYGYPFSCGSGGWLSPEDVLDLFEKNGFSFVKDIDGFYTILILGEKNYIINDRYGIYSLFYAENANSLIISDAVHNIINYLGDFELNKESIYEYLNFGFKIGSKTLIKNVYEFEKATIISIQKGRILKKEKYWSIFDQKQSISLEDYRLLFNQRLNLLSKLESKISLPLTGGLDTRTILAGSLSFKEKLHCYTHGVPGSSDVKIAKKIAETFDLNYDVYGWNQEWRKNLPEILKKNALMFNGNNSLFYVHVLESLKKESYSQEMFLSGSYGNQLLRHFPYNGILPAFKKSEDVSRFVIKSFPGVYFYHGDLTRYYEGLFRNESLSDILGNIQINIGSDLKESNYRDLIDLPEYFIFSNYIGNLGSNIFKLTGKYLKVIGVFFHKDLLGIIPYIPIHEKIQGSYQKYIIKRNNPLLANIEYSKDRNLLLKTVKLLSNRLSEKVIKKELFPLKVSIDYLKTIREYHPEFIKDVLTYDSMETKEIFNKNILDGLVKKYLSNKYSVLNKNEFLLKYSTENLLKNLISLELYLKELKEVKSNLRNKY